MTKSFALDAEDERSLAGAGAPIVLLRAGGPRRLPEAIAPGPRSSVKDIDRLAAGIEIAKHRPIQIMEVCGGHTHSIFRYGIEGMLSKTVELVHGSGRPVCVPPMGRVDDCGAIAERWFEWILRIKAKATREVALP